MKNKKGIAMVGIMITVVISLIVLGIIATQITTQQRTNTITDDQFTASNNSCVRVTNECIGSTTSLENATSAISAIGNFTTCPGGGTGDNWGYLLNAGGADTALDGGTMNSTYVEVDCARLTGITETIISYLPILLALALFIFVALIKLEF